MTEQHLLLARYHYDPLNRLAGLGPPGQANTRFFYHRNRLATQIQGGIRKAIMYAGEQPLAQHQDTGGIATASLLACDQPRSVLRILGSRPQPALAYTAYGHGAAGSGLSSLLGFNGERSDPLTGHYLLGNGYRAFNPVLMRFNSPDSLSPFGKGGINAYAYCEGDPVNHGDALGQGKLRFQLLTPFERNEALLMEIDKHITEFPKIKSAQTVEVEGGWSFTYHPQSVLDAMPVEQYKKHMESHTRWVMALKKLDIPKDEAYFQILARNDVYRVVQYKSRHGGLSSLPAVKSIIYKARRDLKGYYHVLRRMNYRAKYNAKFERLEDAVNKIRGTGI